MQPTSNPIVMIGDIGTDERFWANLRALLPCRTTRVLNTTDMAKIMRDAKKIPNTADHMAQELPDCHLVAHGFLGGMMAWEIAQRAPDKIQRLILINTPLVITPAQKESFRALAQYLETKSRLPLFDLTKKLSVQGFVPPDMKTMVEDVGDKANRWLTLRRQLMAMAAHTPSFDVQTIQIPTQIIIGTQDKFCPTKETIAHAQQCLPHADILKTNTGHHTPVENPVVIAHALYFLSKIHAA